MAIGDAEVVTCRPADLLTPELDRYRTELGDYCRKEEDVLSYALFPQVAMKFFEERERRDPRPVALGENTLQTLIVEDLTAR